MGFPLNYWAIILVAVINMVIGFLWYGPVLGKVWMKEMGFTKESMDAQKAKGMTTSYVLMLVGALVMAYVLAVGVLFGVAYTKTGGAMGGLTAGFWYWLGFVAPVTMGSVLWEGKSWKLWALNAGYYLVVMLVGGAILGAWVM